MEFLIEPVAKIGQVHLKVSDINQSLEFYEAFNLDGTMKDEKQEQVKKIGSNLTQMLLKINN